MKEKKKIYMDSRLKRKIESLTDMSRDGIESYVVRFKDLMDAFWFNSKEDLQNFVRGQEVERYFDKSLRKGYFDYTNEYNETFRYYVECERGSLNLIKEECILA